MKEKFIFVTDLAESILGVRWRETMALCLGVALAFGGWNLYQSHRRSNAQAVQVLFSEALDAWEQATERRLGWDDAGVMTSAIYDSYKTSWAAPYALVLQADAAQRQGNLQEAIQLMARALDELPQGTPFYTLARTKKALLMIQASDEINQNSALKELESLAYDEKNLYADVAFYYWGYLAYLAGERELARQRWTPLVERYGKLPEYASPWALLAEKQLMTLG